MPALIAQAVAPDPALCDLCQKKQKFGSYNYCGKNCAAQAANLCDLCHQKPKFSGHNYCSKNCGAQARSQGLASNGAGVVPSRGIGGKGQNRMGAGAGAKSGIQMPQAGQILNAVAQILPHVVPGGNAAALATTAAQILPHVQALFQPQGSQVMQPSVNQGQSVLQPRGPVKAQQPVTSPQPNGVTANSPNFQPTASTFQMQARTAPAQCQVPGCQQLSHVDPTDGQVGRYCSKLHCEEAVRLGLSDACIMCLKMPQSRDDHFCGRMCREEALSRPV